MKRKLLAIGMICCIFLSGCTTDIAINDEQSDLIAEYTAGILLKHSNVYNDKYVEPETEEETTTEIETQTPEVNPEDETTTSENETTKEFSDVFNVADAMGLKGITIHYKDYTINSEYEQHYLALPTQEGYVYLVVNFTLENTTASDIIANTDSKSTIFRATINGNKKYNNYGPTYANDLSGLSDFTIAAGEKTDVIVVFLIESDIAEKITTLNLSLLSGGQGLTIK